MEPTVSLSMSDAEIEQLAARLAQITNPAALSLEGVDGAVLCTRCESRDGAAE